MLISVDTSLLSHALIPSQMTDDGRTALRLLRGPAHEAVAPLTTFIEFTSTVLKLVRRGIATNVDAQIIVDAVMSLGIRLIDVEAATVHRAWQIATLLGQSDTFDAMGYAVAEAEGGEFWTCDRRFANAARANNLSGVRLFG